MVVQDKKKPNMRDVAKVAGVSVATVSYVLNRKPGQNISEETRKKIFQVINLLDYSPLYYVKQLTPHSSSNIIIQTGSIDSVIKKSELFNFMQCASLALKSNGFNLVYLPDASETSFSHVDGIICYDMTLENFRKISSNNFVPVIAVNSLIDDESLFYQIMPNYQIIKQEAEIHFSGDYLLFVTKPNNADLEQVISSTFNNVSFVNTYDDLHVLASSSLSQNILVTEQSIYEYLQASSFASCNVLCLSAYHDKIINATIDSIKHATARTQNLVHKILV